VKILLISPGYPPVVGGVETVVAGLVDGLLSREAGDLGRGRLEVEVWAHARGGSPERVAPRPGLIVQRFADLGPDRFALSPALWREARRRLADFDLVHVHCYHVSAALAALFRRGVPVAFSPHFHGGGHTALARLAHVPYRPAGRLLFDRADEVIAVSAAERELIGARFPSAGARAVVIPNGVDASSIQAAVPHPDQPPTVLVLGRLERYKRVDRVVAAFLRGSVPGQLVIIGDGSARAELTALIERADLPRSAAVRLLGVLPRSEVERWLRTAHGVVSASAREAFGLIGLEAVAAGGRAVLSSDVTAHREVEQLAPTGRIRLIDPEWPDALARAVDDLLRQRPGPATSVRSNRDMVDDHLAVYRRLLAVR
jgi:glycosyltransferase involved in cell wall biosynthesis